MATDRPKPNSYTLEEAWEFMRPYIIRQQAIGKQATITFDVSVDEQGRITAVNFHPPKVRIA